MISDECFSLVGTTFNFEPYGEIALSLTGTYQPRNAAVAITALETLHNKGYKISNDDIIAGLKSVKWKGRFEVLGTHPVFILDGAHNPQGTEALADGLKVYFKDCKIVFVFGVSADKDVDTMIKPLLSIADSFITIRADDPRAMDEKTLAENLKAHKMNVTAFSSINDGVKEAVKRAGEDGIVCALGSLFLSADVREAYNNLHQSENNCAI